MPPVADIITESCRRAAVPLARLSLFLIYFWFGALKLFGMSPANPLVEQLLAQTFSSLSFSQFIVAFGVFEVIIGLSFIIPRLTWFALSLFTVHMVTTIGPLVLLPGVSWQAPLVPTLEGQYIIKNLALVALAATILAKQSRSSRRVNH